MKKFRYIAAAAAIAVTASALTLFAADDAPVYDPAADPLISLSYINDVLIPAYDEKIAELAAAITDLDTRLIAADEKVKSLTTANTALTGENQSLRTEVDALKKADAALRAENEALRKADEALKAEDAAIRSEVGDGWEIICLKKNAKLLAESPAEVILRSGTALIVSITANGINDVSTGTELGNAADVPLFHFLIVPRGGDGRGLQITSEEAYLMVRGDYSIVE